MKNTRFIFDYIKDFPGVKVDFLDGEAVIYFLLETAASGGKDLNRAKLEEILALIVTFSILFQGQPDLFRRP